MGEFVSILDVPFSKLTLEETTLHLAEQIRKERSGLFHLVTANPEITLASQTDELLQEIIRSADLVVPDGIGIVLAAKRKGDPIPGRVTVRKSAGWT
jgi:N-acetylglucosaminyldiphosphoundecaprenol N-acetyl-beta-D-mannosaminyltransferase